MSYIRQPPPPERAAASLTRDPQGIIVQGQPDGGTSMSPITKTKTLSLGDVGRVFDALQLSSEEERATYLALGRIGEKRDPKHVYVTRLSNGTDPVRADD